jgi:hypothetical protein
MSAKYSISIPTWLDFICVLPLLLYRRLSFGFAFRKIFLTQGRFARVSPLDYYQLIKFKWRLCKSRDKNVLYAERSIKKSAQFVVLGDPLLGPLPWPQVFLPASPELKTFTRRSCGGKHSKLKTKFPYHPWAKYKWSRLLMHRHLIPDVPPGKIIDHHDNNGLDNHRPNLRFATHAQNAWNAKPRKSLAGYKGVTFCTDKNLWRASICVKGNRLHLGYFHSAKDAARAYDLAARKCFGKFARLNFG